MSSSRDDTRKKKRRRRLAAVALGLLVAAACGEGALRWLLFSDSRAAVRIGWRLRQMNLYCDQADDDWWKLQWIFQRDRVSQPPSPDPLLGWTGPVSPGTYSLPEENEIGDRTPVLFFGDSNAQCLTSPDDCFQGLMAQSDLASKYCLLNYGVGGYGLDQIQRLIAASIDRFAGRDPIVVVSMLVDDDLERSMLTFRGWPKPRYRIENGTLVEPGPVETDPNKFLAENPPSITSYLWRLVRGRWRRFDVDRAPTESELAERKALNRALLERIRTDLDGRSVRWFLLLFQLDGSTDKRIRARWSQGVIDEFVADHDAHCVQTHDFFAAVLGHDKNIGNLIGLNDPILQNHLNDGGNKVVFEALRQGLEGRFGNFDFDRVRRMTAEGAFVPHREPPRPIVVLDHPARYEARTLAPAVRFRPADPNGLAPRLSMRCGDDGWLQLDIELDGKQQLISGAAHAISEKGHSGAGKSLRLSARKDAGTWTRDEFTIGADARPWSFGVAGAHRLQLLLEYDGPDPAGAWMMLDDLRIE